MLLITKSIASLREEFVSSHLVVLNYEIKDDLSPVRNTFDKVVIQMAANISAIGHSRTSLFNVTVKMVVTSWWLPGGWSVLSMIVQPCRKVDAISRYYFTPHCREDKEAG